MATIDFGQFFARIGGATLVTGFHMSVDPVEKFDGAGATGSVAGSAGHHVIALFSLLGMAFFGLHILREVKQA
ncbi:MAG: hypothetical protein HY716_00495 [Planctomycetes bacterium]|nr:hypothetical protein [Planctomycetota bacterium]